MKFQVIGSNRETGARMMLELEAESRAAAERKATQSGMSVNRVVDISDGYPAYADSPRPTRRGGGGAGRLLSLIVLAAIVVAIWHFWPQIRHMIHR
jgi:hypothetical protein